MLKKFSYCILFVLLFYPAHPQKQDYIWVFGDSAGINFNNLVSPAPFTSVLQSAGDENYSSISDKNGNLLFYLTGMEGPASSFTFNHSKVFNSNFQLIVNGDSIPSDRSLTQGTLILPSLSDTNQYYLFYLSRNLSATGYPPGLYYAVIDMSSNGGLGEIISKNNLIRSFSNISEKLSAIRHGNGRDWWILMHDYGNNAFYEYLLTPYGIDSIPAQNIGSSYINSSGIQGQMVFSKKGDKLCCAGTGQTGQDGILDIFDYNRCTGILSNWINLNDSLFPFYGCSFSSNGNVLYASTLFSPGRRLYQYDLTASNIVGSKILLFIGHVNYQIGGHQIGPDDKIYIASEYNVQPDSIFSVHNMNLTVINSPDVYGSGCNISPYSFSLGGRRTKLDLPNMVNYNLSKDEGSPCDTIVSLHSLISVQNGITVYPNPASDELNIDYFINKESNSLFELQDIAGKKIFSEILNSSGHHVTLKTDKWEAGTYFYSIYNKNERIKNDKLIILK